MGLALKQIIAGAKVMDEQLAAGYASAGSFNDAFTKVLEPPPHHQNGHYNFKRQHYFNSYRSNVKCIQ